MNNEKSDERGEQSESGQVQMEAFGPPPKVGLLLPRRAKAATAPSSMESDVARGCRSIGDLARSLIHCPSRTATAASVIASVPQAPASLKSAKARTLTTPEHPGPEGDRGGEERNEAFRHALSTESRAW